MVLKNCKLSIFQILLEFGRKVYYRFPHRFLRRWYRKTCGTISSIGVPVSFIASISKAYVIGFLMRFRKNPLLRKSKIVFSKLMATLKGVAKIRKRVFLKSIQLRNIGNVTFWKGNFEKTNGQSTIREPLTSAYRAIAKAATSLQIQVCLTKRK